MVIANFDDCAELASTMPNFSRGTDFDSVDYIKIDVGFPCTFKGTTNNVILLARTDTNEEFEKFYKIIRNMQYGKLRR